MNSGEKAAEVIIVGGGPAGMSAALWCTDLGLDTVLVERESSLGGQLLQTYNPIENYLGLRAENGRDLASHFAHSLEGSSLVRMMRTEVSRIDPGGRRIELIDGSCLAWRALIIATGVRRRQLGVPGEMEFRGKGMIESGARDRELLRGKRLLIVGGGDAAIENALLLSDVADSVKVVYRGRELRAREEFLKSLAGRANVEFLRQTVVSEIVGDSVVAAVTLKSTATGREWAEPVDGVLIRIGVSPNSELVRATVEIDGESYIKVNALCETSFANIFAIGDVANPVAPTISTATGTGAIAVKSIYTALRSQKGI